MLPVHACLQSVSQSWNERRIAKTCLKSSRPGSCMRHQPRGGVLLPRSSTSALEHSSFVECGSASTGMVIQLQPNLMTAATTISFMVIKNSHHVLEHLLPDKTNRQHNLRLCRYNLTLSVKTDARNFIVRQLFRDVY